MKASPPGDKRDHLGLRLRAEQGLGSPLTAPLWVSARRNAFLKARCACLLPPHPRGLGPGWSSACPVPRKARLLGRVHLRFLFQLSKQHLLQSCPVRAAFP